MISDRESDREDEEIKEGKEEDKKDENPSLLSIQQAIQNTNNEQTSLIPRRFKPMPAWQIGRDVSITAVKMFLSYTFTMQQLATAMMMARLDENNRETLLAAAALTGLSTGTIVTIFCSPFLCMNLLASVLKGKLSLEREGPLSEDDRKKIREEISNVFKGGALLSTLILPVPLAIMYFSKYILVNGLHQDEEISGLVERFLRVYMYGLPGLLSHLCAEQIMLAFDESFAAMVMGLVNFSIGTGLAYLLAFGVPGLEQLPRLGIEGIAYGYVAEAYLSLGFCAYIGNSKSFQDIRFFNFMQSNFKDILKEVKNILRMGSSITAQMSFDLYASLQIGIFAGWLGERQLGVHNLVVQLMQLAILPQVAFAQTVAQKMSELMGQGDYHNAMRMARYGLLTTFGFMSCISITVAVKPEWWTTILAQSVDSKTMTSSRKILELVAPLVPVDGALFNMIQTNRTTGDIYFSTTLKIIFLLIGVISAYFLGHVLGLFGTEMSWLLGVALGAMAIFPKWLIGTTEENIKKSQEPPIISSKPQEEGRFYTTCAPWLLMFKGKKEKKEDIEDTHEKDFRTTPGLVLN